MSSTTLLRATSLALVLTVMATCGVAAPPSGDSYYGKVLREQGIKPNATGLSAYFRSLHPGEEQRKRNAQLIRDLGSTESFAKREDAMAKLLVLPVLPTKALVAASEGPDPEVRWRAKQILATGKAEADRVLYAALRTIQDTKPAGLTAELLRAVPLCDKPHLLHAAGEALKAAAREEDADVLRGGLKAPNLSVRAMSVAALGRALGKKSTGDLYPLLGDEHDEVRVAAARAIADFGDRKSLPVLVDLLASDDVNVRVSAALTLRALSGKHFGYAAYYDRDQRKEAIAKWSSWVNGEGRTAKWKYPLKPLGIGVSYLGGNTLLAFGYRSRVVEYDPSEKEVWSFSIPGAWSAEKTADGNVLIASNNGSRVVLVNREKKVVWEYSARNPLNAKPLPGGNVLIAQFSGGSTAAIEVTPDKKVVWQYQAANSCSDVHRLSNGNTLVSIYGLGVQEVTPKGKAVWEYRTNRCYSCQPLPGGGVLLTDIGGQVLEVNREKKVVWEYRANNPVDAFRLPNGNTLVTEANRFIEVTPDKKIIWSKSGCSYGSARR